MTRTTAFQVWMGIVRSKLRRQRDARVRNAANAPHLFWENCWIEGLSPREACTRYRDKVSEAS